MGHDGTDRRAKERERVERTIAKRKRREDRRLQRKSAEAAAPEASPS
jgi:hypothetical protein